MSRHVKLLDKTYSYRGALLFAIAFILLISSYRNTSVLNQHVSQKHSDTAQFPTAAAISKNGSQNETLQPIRVAQSTKATDTPQNAHTVISRKEEAPTPSDRSPLTTLDMSDCVPDANQPLARLTEILKEYANPSRFFNFSKANTTEAGPIVCEFQGKQLHATHFAHSMQQLYGCYSYFQLETARFSNSNLTKILLLSPRLQKQFQTNAFLKGFFRLLEQGLGVRLISRPKFQEEVAGSASSVPASVSLTGGYFLSHATELNELYNSMTENILTTSSGPKCLTQTPRIGILNRRRSSGRSLRNTATLLEAVSSLSNNQTAIIEYFEGKSFEDQVDFFQSVDILVSPHGAQLTGLPFLASKPCTSIVEVFPDRYYIPTFYGSLAQNAGIKYTSLYLSETPVGEAEPEFTIEARKQARSQDLCPSPKAIFQSLRVLSEEWKVCCSS